MVPKLKHSFHQTNKTLVLLAKCNDNVGNSYVKSTHYYHCHKSILYVFKGWATICNVIIICNQTLSLSLTIATKGMTSAKDERNQTYTSSYTPEKCDTPSPFNKKYVPPIKRNCAVAFDYSIQSAIILLKSG